MSFLRPVVAVSAVLIAVSAVAAEDWPRWRGPRGDGTWNAPEIPEQFPEGGPPVVWQQPIGPGYSGIAVTGGRVFTLDRTKGKEEEGILCFDEKT